VGVVDESVDEGGSQVIVAEHRIPLAELHPLRINKQIREKREGSAELYRR